MTARDVARALAFLQFCLAKRQSSRASFNGQFCRPISSVSPQSHHHRPLPFFGEIHISDENPPSHVIPNPYTLSNPLESTTTHHDVLTGAPSQKIHRSSRLFVTVLYSRSKLKSSMETMDTPVMEVRSDTEQTLVEELGQNVDEIVMKVGEVRFLFLNLKV
ncbi:hypothetical protein Hdeb2414_s0152g00815301 [Helianthus debilis subsp. tardiflorus]